MEDLPNIFSYETEHGGNLLHLAVQYSAVCLHEITGYCLVLLK